MTTLRTLTPALARRLAVTRQHLAGPRPTSDAEGIVEVTRDLGCLQLDPISAVARSHKLVLWSRLGAYDEAHLDTLLWEDRRLFEYWAHAASIVLTEDYPIHSHMMRKYATTGTRGADRVSGWVEANKDLRDHIIQEITRNGPTLSRHFESKAETEWASTGWNGGRNVSQMLDYLWTKGIIMVTGRSGGQKVWDLTERVLPGWVSRETLPEKDVVSLGAQRALRALGVATPKHIEWHFIRHRYPELNKVLHELEEAGMVERVQIADDDRKLAGQWYIHRDDISTLERIERGEWEPRTTLLSPFDNLICDRDRTEALFDFFFRIEIYVPQAKRQYGYYVLPILHGDRLIGRIDPTMDRKKKRLSINAVHAEPGAPLSHDVGRDISAAIEELATFLGANEIAYSERVPEGWRAS